MSTFARSMGSKGKLLYRYVTNSIRLLPDFIIIGAQKGGTTSLYRYLSEHPAVVPSYKKEVHYFDLNYQEGLSWYRSQFPLTLERKENHLTGEASPYYLYHPHVPKRVAQLVPNVKLIALLREPASRAYSHYYHEVKNKRDPLSFEEAIDAEEERLSGELEKMLADENYYSYNHQRYSYLDRGIYIDQLLAWERYFDRSQMLVLSSEELFNESTQAFDKVLDFLGLPKWYPEFKQHYANTYPDIGEALLERLKNFYTPHNERLFDHLNTRFAW